MRNYLEISNGSCMYGSFDVVILEEAPEKVSTNIWNPSTGTIEEVDLRFKYYNGNAEELLFEGEVYGNDCYKADDGTYYSIKFATTKISLDELKTIKRETIKEECNQNIIKGTDVELPNGIEHFALTPEDQLNLYGKQAQIDRGVTMLEYHSDGNLCRYYTVDEMNLIIETSLAYINYHTTYCNSLLYWINNCSTENELNDIYYGIDVPTNYSSEVLIAYMANTNTNTN